MGNGTLEKFDSYFDTLVNNLLKKGNEPFNESIPELMRSSYNLHSPLNVDHLPQLVKVNILNYFKYKIDYFCDL